MFHDTNMNEVAPSILVYFILRASLAVRPHIERFGTPSTRSMILAVPT